MADSIYDAAVDPERPNNPHSIALQLVGESRRVLELGSAAGHVTRALVARGNEVVCVELDAEAARGTEDVAQRTIVTDLDWMDLAERLGDERFDVVLAGDVLEHVREPWLVLRMLRGLLRDGGFVVASLPNVADGDVRLMLLEGRFEYHDLGLLDRTHLRFFTKQSLRDLFEEGGFRVSQVFTVIAALGGTELGIELAKFPPELVARIAEDPESIVYQYVVRADPLPGARQDPSPATRPVFGAEDDLGLLGYVSVARRQLAEREGELGTVLDEVRRTATDRAAAIAHLEGRLREVEQVADDRAGAIAHLQGRVEEARAWAHGSVVAEAVATLSIGARLRTAVRRLPVAREYAQRLDGAQARADALEEERLRLNHLVGHLQDERAKGLVRIAELQQIADRHEEEGRHLWVPPGHYYSPVPDVDDIARDQERIHGRDPTDVVGVDLGLARQWERLEELSELARDVPFPDTKTAPFRFWFDNPSYSWGDATVLYGMLQWLRPPRIIEIGSGFSSACTLDTIERHGLNTDVTLIEPYLDTVRVVLTAADLERIAIVEARVQDVPIDRFGALQDGDLLFIDSTHVLKTGSDVHFELLELLPRLAPGVVVHLHDMFPGFEYPSAWVEEGRGWNELYALRALLIGNRAFEVLLWPVLLFDLDESRATSAIPNLARNSGGSLWLRRVA